MNKPEETRVEDHQAATSPKDRFINFIAAFPEQRPPLDLSEMPNAGKIDSLWVVRYIDPEYPETLEKEWEAAQKEDGGESDFELQYFHSARVIISADYYTVVYFQMRQGIGPTGLLAIANYSIDGNRIDQIDLDVGDVYIRQTVSVIIEEVGIRVKGKVMYKFGPDGKFSKE